MPGTLYDCPLQRHFVEASQTRALSLTHYLSRPGPLGDIDAVSLRFQCGFSPHHHFKSDFKLHHRQNDVYLQSASSSCCYSTSAVADQRKHRSTQWLEHLLNWIRYAAATSVAAAAADRDNYSNFSQRQGSSHW